MSLETPGAGQKETGRGSLGHGSSRMETQQDLQRGAHCEFSSFINKTYTKR